MDSVTFLLTILMEFMRNSAQKLTAVDSWHKKGQMTEINILTMITCNWKPLHNSYRSQWDGFLLASVGEVRTGDIFIQGEVRATKTCLWRMGGIVHILCIPWGDGVQIMWCLSPERWEDDLISSIMRSQLLIKPLTGVIPSTPRVWSCFSLAEPSLELTPDSPFSLNLKPDLYNSLSLPPCSSSPFPPPSLETPRSFSS